MGWLASILAGLAWFLGYAGFAKVLRPVVGQMGGRVILGLAGLLTLLALAGLFAREATRAVPLGRGGYALTFSGAATFSAGNLIEGVWLAEFGVRLFALGWRALPLGLGASALLPVWVLALIHLDLPVVLLGLGWVLLGYALWACTTTEAARVQH